MIRRFLAALVAGVVVVLGVTGPAGSAAAAGAPPAAITLVSQPAWTPLGGDLPIALRVDGDPRGLSVRVVVHSIVSSRSGFERTVAGNGLGRTIDTIEASVDSLPTTGDDRMLTIGLQAAGAPADANRVPIPRPGVYPLEISLVDGHGAQIDGFVSHLVAVTPTPAGSPAIGQPLRLSWVWPMVAAPAYTPNDQPDPRVVDQLGPEGRVGSIAGALPQADGVPLTLAPGPETVESWAALSHAAPDVDAGIVSLRTASSVNQTLTGPYVPVNPPSLEANGLGTEIAPEYTAGAAALDTTLGTRVDPRTVVADPVDSASLSRLRALQVDRVVVRESGLVAVSNKFTPAAPFQLESQGRTITAVAADEGLAALLEGDAPVALRAERFLSALAVIAYEQPNLVRGVVVLPRAGWSPSTALLTDVLDGLRGNPLVSAVTLDTLLDTVPVQGGNQPLVRELNPVAFTPTPVTLAQFRAAQSELDALRRLVGRNDPRVARGERALLVSLSSSWQGARGRLRASAELSTITASVNAIVNAVHVPESRTLTLTARTAEIPVSFQNDTGQAISVRVSLDSDKLFFPEGSVRILTLPPRNTTVRFTVETRASGTFPLLLTVTSPDRQVTFQRSRITVRSTVVSNVGIFLTVGAGLFLAAWWLNHARRRRRGPRAGVADPTPAAAPA